MKFKQHVKLFESYHSIDNLRHIGLSKKHADINVNTLLKIVKHYREKGEGTININKAIIGPRLVYAGRKRGNQPIMDKDDWEYSIDDFIEYLEGVIQHGENSRIYVNGTLSYKYNDKYISLVSNSSLKPHEWTYYTPSSEKYLQDIRRGVYNDYDDYSDNNVNDYDDDANDYDDYSDRRSKKSINIYDDYNDYSD